MGSTYHVVEFDLQVKTQIDDHGQARVASFDVPPFVGSFLWRSFTPPCIEDLAIPFSDDFAQVLTSKLCC